MDNVDLYGILGVPRDVSPEDMKRAYKKLCIQHHPDKGGDENEFKKVSEAYNILKDPEKRRVYDQYGLEGLRQGAGGFDENMQSMMENLFGFKFPFAGGRGGPPTKQKTHKILELTLEDVVNGNPTFPYRLSRKVLNRKKEKVTCNLCKGQGFRVMLQNVGFMQMQQQVKCPQCQGHRYERHEELFDTVEEVVHLVIPRNCAENHAFILKNRMDEDVDGEPMGDVVVVVKYAPHSRFRREGASLVLTVDMSFVESIAGFERKLVMVNGSCMDVSFPSMIRWNERLCIPGKGLFMNHSYGDLFLEFKVAYPDEVDTEVMTNLQATLDRRPKSGTWAPDTMKWVAMPSSVSASSSDNEPSAPPRQQQQPFQGPPMPPPGGARAMECHQQ